jgi:hypothetical protein
MNSSMLLVGNLPTQSLISQEYYWLSFPELLSCVNSINSDYKQRVGKTLVSINYSWTMILLVSIHHKQDQNFHDLKIYLKMTYVSTKKSEKLPQI